MNNDKCDASKSLFLEVFCFQSTMSWDTVSKQNGIISWMYILLFFGQGETEVLGALANNWPTVAG
jgi:hypothetical protein